MPRRPSPVAFSCCGTWQCATECEFCGAPPPRRPRPVRHAFSECVRASETHEFGPAGRCVRCYAYR